MHETTTAERVNLIWILAKPRWLEAPGFKSLRMKSAGRAAFLLEQLSRPVPKPAESKLPLHFTTEPTSIPFLSDRKIPYPAIRARAAHQEYHSLECHGHGVAAEHSAIAVSAGTFPPMDSARPHCSRSASISFFMPATATSPADLSIFPGHACTRRLFPRFFRRASDRESIWRISVSELVKIRSFILSSSLADAELLEFPRQFPWARCPSDSIYQARFMRYWRIVT